MYKADTGEKFLALYEGSNVMIETLDRFYDSNCFCSCLPLVTQLLKEVHYIANDLMDGIAEARKGLEHGDLYDIAVYNHYILDTIVRFLEIIARHNPCDDYSKTCDISILLRRLYSLACGVSGDLAYISYNIANDDGNNGCGCGENETPNPPKTEYVNCNDDNDGNGSKYYDDDEESEVAKRIRESIYIMAQTRKLTDIMFYNLANGSCGDDNKGIYQAILDNIDKCKNNLKKAQDDAELEDFTCLYCNSMTNIQTAIGMLNSMKYVVEYFRDNEDYVEYCMAIDAESMFSIQIYAPYFGSLVRIYKVIEPEE